MIDHKKGIHDLADEYSDFILFKESREDIKVLIGETFTGINIAESGKRISFIKESPTTKYTLRTHQQCCVTLDGSGNPMDLLGEPITDAREEVSDDNDGSRVTSYHLSTSKGSVIIRWTIGTCFADCEVVGNEIEIVKQDLRLNNNGRIN